MAIKIGNIEEQDLKDLSEDLVHELQVSGLLMLDHEAINAYVVIYNFLKGKYNE